MRALSTVVFFCLVFAGAGGGLTARAENPREFEEANQFYAQGKFQDAKQRYDALVKSGNWSAHLFYNLADAEWKLGNPGAAALNYERALALEPSLPEARANLQFLQGQTGAKLEPARWWRRLLANWSANAYAVMAAAGAWIAIFFVAAIALRRRAESGARWLGAAVGALACAYGLGGAFLYERNGALAIVTAKRAEARFAPTDTAPIADTLPTASRVRVLQERGPWTYAELPGGARAWVATDAIARVRLSHS